MKVRLKAVDSSKWISDKTFKGKFKRKLFHLCQIQLSNHNKINDDPIIVSKTTNRETCRGVLEQTKTMFPYVTSGRKL